MANNYSTSSCDVCSAPITGRSLFDTQTCTRFCDRGCYKEWAHQSSQVVDYYAEFNLEVEGD